MKPFKPPTLLNRPNPPVQHTPLSSEPPAKKRRISYEADDNDPDVIDAAANALKKQTNPIKTFQAPVRKALLVVKNPSSSPIVDSNASARNEGYYTVLWRNFTMKKNKTWDGDGVLSVSGGYANLQDVSGRGLGRGVCKGPLLVGSEFSVGGKEVEVEAMISKEDFLAGRPFVNNAKPPTLTLKKGERPAGTTLKKIAPTQKHPLNASLMTSGASKGAFRAPLLHNNVQLSKNSKVPVPRHDVNGRVNGKEALVMKRPSSVPKDKQIVDVVVDPLLTAKLRDHQREGVSFLYECVMGMRDHGGEGAILADEMGLGKTLTTIALLWTLLKQNPVYEDSPVIKKALIVCPVTLIKNWRTEFHKWLGKERLGIFIVDNDKRVRLTDFTKGKAYSVMIIGYEKLRLVQADLQQGSGIDIVIADEGHRMKTAQNKAALAIKSLNTERRIILSGTPIQNDLAEFHTMVDFVNPGLLNKYSKFKREFENPILKARQPDASEKDVEQGEARGKELADITGTFILRRTIDLLSKYLPTKTEYVLFCKPTAAQRSVYRAITGSAIFNAALGSSESSLELITILKKVCNSPNLLLKKNDKGEIKTKPELLELIPPSVLKSAGASGKLQVLDSLLHQIRTTTDEKVVLVSNYTSTMDILANLLTSLSYTFVRLDGSTPANKRQGLVDRFNRSPPSNSFVFLLSAKAGGTGINLIGASRLVLFDLDWNPATDLQAMARIHRDGQKRPCYIYRMLTQGALDEKIFQRQVSKTGLADSIVDSKDSVSGFTREELRDLFRLDESEGCQTHKLLGCDCGGSGMPLVEPEDEPASPRNDLASLSASDKDVVRDASGTEILYLDNDDPQPVYKAGTLKSAKDYDWQAEEEGARRSRRGSKDASSGVKMLSLMQYAHFDTTLVTPQPVEAMSMIGEEDAEVEMPSVDPLEGVIEDSALRNVLREEERRIGYVFSKLGG